MNVFILITPPYRPPPQSFHLVPLDRSLTLDKAVSLHLTVPFGWNTPDYLTDHTYPFLKLPSLLHLTLQSHHHMLPQLVNENSPAINYSPFLSVARDLLSILDPITFAACIVHDVHRWISCGHQAEQWKTGEPRWNRLESVRFVDCSWFRDDEDNNAIGFFIDVLSPSISFSWAFSLEYGGYAGGKEPLICLGQSKVLDHPSVRAKGVDLDIGDRPEDRMAVERDLEKLPAK
jgi:hypothetical protein